MNARCVLVFLQKREYVEVKVSKEEVLGKQVGYGLEGVCVSVRLSACSA